MEAGRGSAPPPATSRRPAGAASLKRRGAATRPRLTCSGPGRDRPPTHTPAAERGAGASRERPRCAGRAPRAAASPGSQPPAPAALRTRLRRGVRPGRPPGPGGQRRAGPAAATRRREARPAWLRAAASRGRRGSDAGTEGRASDATRRRCSPPVRPNLGPPPPGQPLHLGRGQWRPLPRRRPGRAAGAAGTCSSGRSISGLGGSAAWSRLPGVRDLTWAASDPGPGGESGSVRLQATFHRRHRPT